MLGKHLILWTLLVTAVPSGCVPIMTVGIAIEEARSWRNPPRGRHPDALRNGLIGAAIGVVLSIVLVLLFRQQLQRTRELGATYALGLSGDAYRLLLWVAFFLGIGCGVGMLISTTV